MPERSTKDIDFLVGADDFETAERRLRDAGYAAVAEHDDLFFANSMLGLFGRAWRREGIRIDLISSRQEWVHDALTAESYDQTGLRVIALPYLVLMKLDASRGQDQADVERMLGRLNDAEVERIARIVDRYSGDPQAAEDVRQYAILGRMEYERDRASEHEQPG
ncbi:MAG: nucleotidyltransferase family protein [Candidatus Eremiobacteraeota bacterium]|nr:nucleotidyltransferase family protein [Candidatus Eremiobacteraeota bacterium]